MGSLYKRGNVWWMKYYRNGRPFRESAETDKEQIARNKLRDREGHIARGVPVTPQMTRTTIDELLAAVVTDYRNNDQRTTDAVERRIKLHLKPFFGGMRAAAITADDVERFKEKRREAEASNAEINRELAILKRAYTLGTKRKRVLDRPAIELLQEHNTRKGFFEREQFEKVRKHLPPHIKPVATFAYLTGWRINSEVLPLTWRQVDFKAGIVRLEPGTTKNDEAREVPFAPLEELRVLLEAQRDYTEHVQKERGIICPWVFHRGGKQVRYFRRSWLSACTKAGCPDRIPHDFRRTAVRNLMRAGVSEHVAMKITGHKTNSVFKRYHIVSPADLAEAARRLNQLHASDTSAKNATGTNAGTIST